jgi:hypothetical protein
MPSPSGNIAVPEVISGNLYAIHVPGYNWQVIGTEPSQERSQHTRARLLDAAAARVAEGE